MGICTSISGSDRAAEAGYSIHKFHALTQIKIIQGATIFVICIDLPIIRAVCFSA